MKTVKPFLPQLLLILFGCFILIITPYQVEITKTSGQSPRVLPYFVGVIIVILSLITLISTILQEKRTRREEQIRETHQNVEKKNYIRVFVVFLLLGFWIVLLEHLGFLITTALLVMGLMYTIGERKLMSLVFIPSLFSVCIYFVFKVLLKISLPEGIFL